MAASIATSIIACLKSFNDFIADVGSLPPRNTGELGLVPTTWEDELGRLRMWAANIGAHQTGQSSLDFRLRDSSHIRDQILKLLQDLLQRLQDAREVLAEGEEAANNDEIANDTSDDEEPTTEIQELRESVATIINCLFQMSMLVRKPAQHDMIMGSRRAEVAMFEPFDYNHVRDKYPRADESIVERLGVAVTRRRKYLKYRERHALKLKQGINKVIPERDGETVVEGTVSLLSDTIATDIKESNIRFDDGGSDSGVSQTSYAQTLLSGGDITIPKPPKIAQGGSPFECPFCHFIITTKGTRSWNRHVFQDLQPYICLAITCNTPDKLFSTRHEWLHHSKTVHPTDFSPHKEEIVPSFICPLCREDIQTERQYDRHVARHLQELALFILPRTYHDSDVSENGSGSDEGSDPESDEHEGLSDARNLQEKLDSCSHLLHERYGPACTNLRKEGAFDNHVKYSSLRDGLEDVVSTLQGLDLEDQHDMEHQRKLSLDLAKGWLNTLGYAAYDALHEKDADSADNLTKDASERTRGPAALDFEENKKPTLLADVKQQTKGGLWKASCKACGHQFDGNQSIETYHQCPDCSSSLVDFIHLDDGDLHYEDSEDNIRDHNLDPDVLVLRHKGMTYPLYFPAYSIAEVLKIGQLRRQAAEAVSCNDTRRVDLAYKGRKLCDDSKQCREEGLKMNSEIMCMVLNEPQPFRAGTIESDESRPPSPRRATESAPVGGLRTPEEILQAIADDLHADILPRVRRLLYHPPDLKEERDYKSEVLSKRILFEVLHRLDLVQMNDEEIKARQRDLVKKATHWIGELYKMRSRKDVDAADAKKNRPRLTRYDPSGPKPWFCGWCSEGPYNPALVRKCLNSTCQKPRDSRAYCEVKFQAD